MWNRFWKLEEKLFFKDYNILDEGKHPYVLLPSTGKMIVLEEVFKNN